jgi:hypothetical protein
MGRGLLFALVLTGALMSQAFAAGEGALLKFLQSTEALPRLEALAKGASDQQLSQMFTALKGPGLREAAVREAIFSRDPRQLRSLLEGAVQRGQTNGALMARVEASVKHLGVTEGDLAKASQIQIQSGGTASSRAQAVRSGQAATGDFAAFARQSVGPEPTPDAWQAAVNVWAARAEAIEKAAGNEVPAGFKQAVTQNPKLVGEDAMTQCWGSAENGTLLEPVPRQTLLKTWASAIGESRPATIARKGLDTFKRLLAVSEAEARQRMQVVTEQCKWLGAPYRMGLAQIAAAGG